MWLKRLIVIQRLTSSIVLRRSNQVNTNSEQSQTHPTDLYHWNITMTESNKRQTPEKTLALFEKLINEHPEINPNFITYLVVLGACIRLGNLHEGKRIHQYIDKRWSTTVDSNEAVKVQTCLVQLYATCGDLTTGKHCSSSRCASDLFLFSSRRNFLQIESKSTRNTGEYDDERLFDASSS